MIARLLLRLSPASAVVIAAGLFTASVSLAAESNTEQQMVVIEKEERKICKRFVPTGSRIARRYCLPKRQWDQMQTDGQRAAREAFRDESQVMYKPPD